MSTTSHGGTGDGTPGAQKETAGRPDNDENLGLLHSEDLNKQILQYSCENRMLFAKLAAKEAENGALRAANNELSRRLEEELLDSSRIEDFKRYTVATASQQLVHSGVEGENRASLPLEADTAIFLLSALQDSNVYVAYSDLDLRYVWVNRTWNCFTIKGILGRRDDDLFPPGTQGVDDMMNVKSQALVTMQPQVAEICLFVPLMGCRSLIMTSRPHFNRDGILVGISTASIDITSQVVVGEHGVHLKAETMGYKAMEEEFREAVQQIEQPILTKNRFLSIMSHEIRTPLNGLIGLAEALDSTDLNVEQREMVKSMQSSGFIIADILSDILDLASMDHGGSMKLDEKPFSPAEVVANILKMAVVATSEKAIGVDTEVNSNVPRQVIGDPVRVQQVMKYLVLNAIKFTHCGRVSVHLGVKDVNPPSNSSPVIPGEKLGPRGAKFVAKRKSVSDVDDRDTTISPAASFGSSYQKGVYKHKGSDNSQSLAENSRENIMVESSEYFVGKFRKVGGSNMPSFPLEARKGQRTAGRNNFQPDLDAMPGIQTFEKRGLESISDTVFEHHDEVLLWCDITDTGVGIPKEAFPTLFDKFTQVNSGSTRAYGGIGLGLAVCKQLVELMGGELTVASEVGKGSVFSFTVLCKVAHQGEGDMPLPNDPTDELPPSKVSEIRSSCSCDPQSSSQSSGIPYTEYQPRILLAEDNKVNVVVAISMLKRLGFTAQVVCNGVEALEAIRKENYDLVLLDICMPLMDGLQVAYAIRRHEETGLWPEDLGQILGTASHSLLLSANDSQGEICAQAHRRKLRREMGDTIGVGKRGIEGVKRLPIVAVTANALKSDVDMYFAHGMDAFIAKPVMFQELRETLAKYLPIQEHQLRSGSHVGLK